jgi:catecholate siderophore receptor
MGIADLDPEENYTTELGVKWQLFDRRVMASAAVFQTEKRNARTQDPNNPNDLLVLAGQQKVNGVELGLAGNITETVAVSAGYTYLDSEITQSKDPAELGKQLPNSPRNSFNLWSTWNVQSNVQLGLGAQYVDKRYNSIANTRYAPQYWIYEASASYVVNPKLNFRLNLQNLTDKDYIDFVGGGHFIPGMGRLAMLSANYSF